MTKKQVTFYQDKSDIELFNKKYPNIASVFFRRCVIRALMDTNFFQDVFFNTPDKLPSTK